METIQQISQEDIELLDSKYYAAFKYPMITFAISAVLLTTTKFLSVPKFFRNPLESPQGNELFYSRLSKMAKPPLLLYGACVGGAIGLFQYEFAKYKQLVNIYLDACESLYINELRKSQQN